MAKNDVKIIVGGSGTGKTTVLCDRIKEEKNKDVGFVVLSPLEKDKDIFLPLTANRITVLPIYDTSNNKIDYTCVEEFERIFLSDYHANIEAVKKGTSLTKRVFMFDGFSADMLHHISVEELIETLLTCYDPTGSIEIWLTTQENAESNEDLAEIFSMCNVMVLDKK